MNTIKLGEVLAEVARERQAQDKEWGGPVHDDNEHGPSDWMAFIRDKGNKALEARTDEEYRKRLVQIAALAVAAVESLDRLMGEQ
jgi:hypothetical protein